MTHRIEDGRWSKDFIPFRPDGGSSRLPKFVMPESILRENPHVRELNEWIETTDVELDTDPDYLLLAYSLLPLELTDILDIADEAKENFPEINSVDFVFGCHELVALGWAIIGNEIEI